MQEPHPHDITLDAQTTDYGLIVSTIDQSRALSLAGIPATTPSILLSAPGELARQYLLDNLPIVLVPPPSHREAFSDVRRLLWRLRLRFTEVRELHDPGRGVW